MDELLRTLNEIVSQTVPQINGERGDETLHEMIVQISNRTGSVEILLAEFVQRAMTLIRQDSEKTPSIGSGEAPQTITSTQKTRIRALLRDLPFYVPQEQKGWIQFLIQLHTYQTTGGTWAFLREVSEQILKYHEAKDTHRLGIIIKILQDCDLIRIFRERERIQTGEKLPKEPQAPHHKHVGPKPIIIHGKNGSIKTLLETLEYIIEGGFDEKHIGILREHFGKRDTIEEFDTPKKPVRIFD